MSRKGFALAFLIFAALFLLPDLARALTEPTWSTSNLKTLAFGVRKDTPAAVGQAEGDRVPLRVDNTGKLWVTGTTGGDATAANQATANTQLTAINANTDTIEARLPASLGTTTAAGSLPVTLSTDGPFALRFPLGATLADAAALPSATSIGAVGLRYNGATLDLERGAVDGAVLASAARTATTNSADLTNYNGRGAVVYLNITAASGTGGLQVGFQGKDPVSGSYRGLNALATAIITTGVFGVELYPGASTAGNMTQVTSQVLPRTFRIQIAHGDASSYTYSVGISILP